MRTRPAAAVIAALALACALVLLGWASFDGRTLVEVEPTQLVTAHETVPPPTGSGSPTATTTSLAPHHAPADPGQSWIWTVIGVLLALAVVALVAVVTRRLVRALRPLPRPQAPDQPLVSLDRLVEASVPQLERSLHDGTPRNGIVECWHLLEQLVAAAGHPRRPDETSSELVLRVLEEESVPREPLQRLNALYREARFSRHELSEEHRTAAAESLAAIRAALGAHR